MAIAPAIDSTSRRGQVDRWLVRIIVNTVYRKVSLNERDPVRFLIFVSG